MKFNALKQILLSIFLIVVFGVFYLVGYLHENWSGLSILALIWLIGLGIIALGVCIAERFGKKWAPVLIIGMLSGFTILADLGCIKLTLIKLGSFELIAPAGSLLFAVLYFGGDYLNEFYGKRVAKINVYAGWLAKITVAFGMLFIIYIMQSPSIPDIVETNQKFDELLSLGPRLNIASIIAILIAGLVNVELFSVLRILTRGKYLWLRSFVSSTTAIIVDNIVFTFGAFLFVIPTDTIWNMAWTTSAVHLSIALWAPIFIYILMFLKNKKIIGSQELLTISKYERKKL